MKQDLALHDIQGIILNGYGRLRSACFLLLGIENGARARQWLERLAPIVRNGVSNPREPSVNVAFTWRGLRALGLNDEKSAAIFSREFREGMTTEHRQRILGDVGASAPERWAWGGLNGRDRDIGRDIGRDIDRDIDAVLLLYAPDEAALAGLYAVHERGFAENGLVEIRRLDTILLEGRKEHFGFRDSIAQPVVDGFGAAGTPENTVAPGEFLLGHPNEYGQCSDRPKPPGAPRDLDYNGTYLVMRQLQQDVRAFWKYVDAATTNPDGSSNAGDRLRVASKMVGRWPSGAPMVLSPVTDDHTMENHDSFGYRKEDPHGILCPAAAHIRRSNPRDAPDLDSDPNEAVKIVKRHRMIRRGRAYGAPVAASMRPEEILSSRDDGADRGLHFLCFNANISRQFEFIQQTWINSPKFGALYDSPDPLLGNPAAANGNGGTFVIPGDPVRRRLCNLPQFVTVRGGAYFFMPSISALHRLSQLP